ncbi:hypothetical protein GCM10007315_30860 [Gemmobacter tilapiae]|uniref:Heparinase II/III-like C-terminal domain-containing protein n=2 Tax=Neogemmobacter tilapiae TaxID=875041 RepID=A0A918WPM2_9RHOB|nr:hypothetical protein GCM10007315_30860 [Gemmobacter tilapiae]
MAAWRAGRARAVTGFVSPPEPRTIGHVGRGRQLLAGNFRFGGQLVTAPGTAFWEIAAPDLAFQQAMQGFGWLDDLAAVGDSMARIRAQGWVWDWIAAYGRGKGPGWLPELTGRRLTRLINHSAFLLQGQDPVAVEAFLGTLSAQTAFLQSRWAKAPAGLPRIEALTGLLQAGLSLSGLPEPADMQKAAQTLGQQAAEVIDAQGGLASRNPEELLEIFALLTWAAQALTDAEQAVDAAHLAALQRIAPTLRALRHADGGLARFHGGDRGAEGWLDAALAASGVKPAPVGKLVMGYARLQGGRTTVIADAATPPGGAHRNVAHASTLGFELTSARRPLIISTGSGAAFGGDWHKVGRATASHSALVLDGMSSSRFGAGEVLSHRAQVTLARPLHYAQGNGIHMAQDGWARSHGLMHSRELVLSSDGRSLSGQDELTALTPADRKRLDAALIRHDAKGIPFALHFHLHPDVAAVIEPADGSVVMQLRSGEIWLLRCDSGQVARLAPSALLEPGQNAPQPCLQIVLEGFVRGTETRIVWTLAKSQDTPQAIRDTESD